MPSIEDELIQLLRDRAERMPVHTELITAAKARSHRMAVRRNVGIALATAAAVGLVAAMPAAIQVLRHESNDRPVVANSGKPATDFLLKAPSLRPTFPLTPTYLPSGVRQPPQISLDLGTEQALYLDDRGRGADFISGVAFSVSEDEPTPLANSQGVTPITVHGRTGIFITRNDGLLSVLTWERKPRQWVSVQGSYEWSARSVLLRAAEGLIDKPQTGLVDFTVARAPAGYVLTGYDLGSITLTPPDDPSSFATVSARSHAVMDGRRVKVGKRTGSLSVEGRASYVVQILLSSTESLEIRVSARAPADPWTEATALRFAEGVEYIGPRPILDRG